MKKLNAYLLAVALLLGMTQCKKEQPASGTTTDGGETVYITMKVDNGGRHIVYPGTGAVVYGEGDVIYVGNDGHYVGSLTYQNGAFSGNITSPSTADYLHFYFVGGQTPSVTPQAGSTTDFTVSIADQSNKLPVLSYGKSNTKYIDGNTAYTCMLENKCGLVKFVPSISTSEAITVSGMKTMATINFATPGITPTATTGAMTLYSESNAAKWAILLPQEQIQNANVSIAGNDLIAGTVNVTAVTDNMYYDAGVEIPITLYAPAGAIGGKFTINSNGGQVRFSQGNLQFQGSTGTWRFATNQYDFVGGYEYGQGPDYGNVYEGDSKCSNANIDRNYSGWIDQFGWGTSGYYVSWGPYRYNPWDYQEEATNYYNNGLSGTNYDWGVYHSAGTDGHGSVIVDRNGHATTVNWRTLTWQEWSYVLGTRKVMVNGTQKASYGLGVVNGVHGLIILPDNWDGRVCSSFTYGNQQFPNVFSSNSTPTWDDMETVGCVFLPSGGWRRGKEIRGMASNTGYYWTATNYSSQAGRYMLFGGSSGSVYIDDNQYTNKYHGHCVRVVTDAPAQ